jgi:sister-chromatid-cohesion protein PDS5
VSLLCARIVAEVMRICAPEAPYTDEEAKSVVFPLLLQHLQGLQKPSGSEFAHVCELLQSLAVCKCFVMLAYTDMGLLLKLVEQLFATVQAEHFESRVAETMLQIMVDVTTELDEVPPELLEAIFSRLQSPAKTEAPEAYQLAKHLLLRLAKSMEVPLSSYLAQLLETGGQRAAELQESDELNKMDVEKARKELQADVFDVLFEVLLVAPDLLLHALPSLERDVTSEIAWWRKLVVEALCRMFAEPSSKLRQDNLGTLAVLLERFKVSSLCCDDMCS